MSKCYDVIFQAMTCISISSNQSLWDESLKKVRPAVVCYVEDQGQRGLFKGGLPTLGLSLLSLAQN